MAFANVTKAKIDKRKNNFYACGKMGRYAKKCPDKVNGQENTTKGMAVTVIYREKEVDGDFMLYLVGENTPPKDVDDFSKDSNELASLQ